MKYIRSEKYSTKTISDLFMGPNPIKLTEELLLNHQIPNNATVMDLGCGRGVTSVFLAREYGFRVFATDLWVSATENQRFFEQMGLTSDRIVPIHADATALPYAEEFFDAVISIDSYQYFGHDTEYLGRHLLPFVKRGGYIYICIPGMKKDCHGNLPPELLLSWTPDQLETIHDADYWRSIICQTHGIDILSIHEMESNEEVWNDWLACDNEYARGDRKTIEAGGCQYLNFIAIILRRR